MTATTSPTDGPSGLVAVVGATGLQGGATARALLDRGAGVRALARNPESDSARELVRLGVDVVQADLTDPASLRAAFTDVGAVFAMATPGREQDAEAETAHGLAIVDAAKAVDVPLVVYSSVGGAERSSGIPHFESKRKVEEHLAASGLAAVLVRPVFFMDNFAQFMAPQVEDGALVVRMPMPGDIPLQLVAAVDVGQVCAEVVLHPDRVVGGAIEIAGDELTGDQIAAAFGQRYGLPARYEALPVEVLGDNQDMQAMFRWFAELPAYQADFARMRELLPDTLTFAGWLAQQPEL